MKAHTRDTLLEGMAVENRTAYDDVTLIRRLMSDAQGAVSETGIHQIWWGAWVAVALTVSWAASTGALDLGQGWIWIGFLLVGWIGGWVLGAWEDERSPVRTVAGRMTVSVWIGIGVAATIVGLAGAGSGTIADGATQGVISALIGAGYFASGAATQLRWVRWLGVAWWVGATVMLVRPGPHTKLVMAGMALAFNVVPGIVLFLRRRRDTTSG
jgi:hypothetical protein